MTLLRRVLGLWKHRLSDGWAPFLSEAGLKLNAETPSDFREQLLRKIDVNFDVPGIEEFARDGCRAIEPGDPARSLLYHVLASPLVQPVGLPLDLYPTPTEIEVVENLVFGIEPPTLDDLRKRAPGGELAIAVFAYEYGPAPDTVHECHADLCFSRTGISRVGNADAEYRRDWRGYFPFRPGRKDVQVIPCRYAAWIAARVKGERHTIGPQRFKESDRETDFWVPLHKLFSGSECIRNLNLNVDLEAHHRNDKIRRVHEAVIAAGVRAEYSPQQMSKPPFVLTEDLAAFSTRAEDGTGLLEPVPHPLVEPAKDSNGRYIGFEVPPGHDQILATLQFRDVNGGRRSPEMVHVKHQITPGRNQKIRYLPEAEATLIEDVVRRGKYTALNFVDYTADGWVEARCRELLMEIPKRLSAYSIIGQPDFFPRLRQQDLYEWWEHSSPEEIRSNIWAGHEEIPIPLSDSRMPANITLTGAGFDSRDTTITAIVSVPRQPARRKCIQPTVLQRASTLSYRATSLFAPGWDVSIDFNSDANSPGGVHHLASYGLGSPFAEDMMLCAAAGSFWPGAVPDTTRYFRPGTYPTVTPLPDAVQRWDGNPLPRVVQGSSPEVIEFRRYSYSDYVRRINGDALDYQVAENIDLNEYVRRTLTMARIFQVLGAADRTARARWAVLSFRPATAKEIVDVGSAGSMLIPAETWYVEMATVHTLPGELPDPKIIHLQLRTREIFIADIGVVAQLVNGEWKVRRF